MLIFHKLDAANVLPLDGLGAPIHLHRDCGVRDIHKDSRIFLSAHFNELNPLAGLKRVQVLPGRLIVLSECHAGHSKYANQNQESSHRVGDTAEDAVLQPGECRRGGATPGSWAALGPVFWHLES
jgi:hypothetical protein